MQKPNSRTPLITFTTDAGWEGFYNVMYVRRENSMFRFVLTNGAAVEGTYIDSDAIGSSSSTGSRSTATNLDCPATNLDR